MIDVGYAKTTDLLEVQSKKTNVERLIAQMKSNEELLYHYISFLLNKKVTNIVVPENDVNINLSNDDEIIKNNIDIQRATTGLEIRKSMIGVDKATYYPMVGAFAEMATADDSFLGDAGDHMAYTIGARLTWNIYNGGIDDAKIEKSRIEHLKMKNQVQLAKKGIALQVNALLKDLDNWIDLSTYIDKKAFYETMGVDRIFASLAISDGVIVDAGSAVTVDVVKNGDFKGGFIYPGKKAMQKTFKDISPALDYQFNYNLNLKSLPKNTTDAISYGYLKTLYTEVIMYNLPIYLTGGDSKDFLKIFPNAILDEMLIFKGMKKIIDI